MREWRVWRAATGTLVVVWIFLVLAVVAIPLLALTLFLTSGHPVIAVVLLLLTVAAGLYGWRLGLYPRLMAHDGKINVRNPFHTVDLPLHKIRSIDPGENGIRLGTDDTVVEAWCVQKSRSAIRRGKLTRADRIVTELRSYLPTPVSAGRSPYAAISPHSPAVDDEPADLVIRRARASEAETLATLERSASTAMLAHVFPPDRYPYPYDDVTKRWRETLADRSVRVRIAEVDELPVGYLAYHGSRIRHLGVDPQFHRRGFGTELLDYAIERIFDECDEAWLWVLKDNVGAQTFYRRKGFHVTGEQQDCPYDPHPVEIKMILGRPDAS